MMVHRSRSSQFNRDRERGFGRLCLLLLCAWGCGANRETQYVGVNAADVADELSSVVEYPDAEALLDAVDAGASDIVADISRVDPEVEECVDAPTDGVSESLDLGNAGDADVVSVTCPKEIEGPGTIPHCDDIQWNAQAKAVSLPTEWTLVKAPESIGYTKECKPDVNTCCDTVCDCKFVRVGDCFFGAVNVSEPWDAWGNYYAWGTPTTCWSSSCATKVDLPVSVSLSCEFGHCRASGPHTVLLF